MAASFAALASAALSLAGLAGPKLAPDRPWAEFEAEYESALEPQGYAALAEPFAAAVAEASTAET